MVKNCLYCDKEFEVPKFYQIKKFCSFKCSNIHKQVDFKGRFMSHIEKTDSCWIWNGSKNYYGYGLFQQANITYRAHRFAYKLFVAEIPEGMVVCHKCDNPPCVNPDHLFVGTHYDNILDKMSKGRATGPKGPDNRCAILDEEKVRKIRTLFATGRYTKKDLAKMFDVGPTAIFDVLRGHTWKHVA